MCNASPQLLRTQAYLVALHEARALWARRCLGVLGERGDDGTCVLGAGIADAKTGQLLIRAADVTPAQGSLVWERHVEEVLAFLAEAGIAARYVPGVMD